MSKTAVVLGASGYIGSSIAIAFRRQGYRVFGISRSNNFAGKNFLEKNGVLVTVAQPVDPHTYEDVLLAAHVVVDATHDHSNPNRVPEQVLHVLETEKFKIAGARRTYLYCSGLLAQGETPPGQVADEFTPKGPKASVWRNKLEGFILNSNPESNVNRAVLRPGFVYGGSGGFLAQRYFESTEVEGDPSRRLSWVHVDDAADAFVRAARMGDAVNRLVFNITEENAPTWGEAREAMFHAAGGKGPMSSRSCADDEAWMNVNVNVTSRRAREILGWIPAHAGPVVESRESYLSYKAHL